MKFLNRVIQTQHSSRIVTNDIIMYLEQAVLQQHSSQAARVLQQIAQARNGKPGSHFTTTSHAVTFFRQLLSTGQTSHSATGTSRFQPGHSHKFARGQGDMIERQNRSVEWNNILGGVLFPP